MQFCLWDRCTCRTEEECGIGVLRIFFDFLEKVSITGVPSNISLEQASEITGIDIENLQKLEGGERCMFKDVMAYHAFFLEYIPNGVERYQKFLNKVLVSHGHEEIDFEDINWDDEEETDAEEVKD